MFLLKNGNNNHVFELIIIRKTSIFSTLNHINKIIPNLLLMANYFYCINNNQNNLICSKKNSSKTEQQTYQ